MGRKQLHGLAKNLTQIFVGHQLHEDLVRLEPLWGGLLEIDVLSLACRHDGRAIDSLKIATILHDWFRTQSSESSVPMESIDVAKLTVRFGARVEPAYVHDGVQHMQTIFAFECASRVEAFGDVYEAQERGQRELA
jgi:hypothetical protein